MTKYSWTKSSIKEIDLCVYCNKSLSGKIKIRKGWHKTCHEHYRIKQTERVCKQCKSKTFVYFLLGLNHGLCRGCMMEKIRKSDNDIAFKGFCDLCDEFEVVWYVSKYEQILCSNCELENDRCH